MMKALLLAATLLIPATAPAQTGSSAAATTTTTQRDHISIRDEGGSGSTVILIPGLASPRAVWDGVVPDLKARHRVLTVQVNGFAGDDARANLKPGILDGIVAELDGYIRERRIAAPAIVGHSMGGLVAMMLAVRHPESVGGVMVVDALPFIGTLFVPGATVQSVAPMAAQMKAGMLAAPVAAAPITSDPGGIWSNTPGGRIKVANWGRVADLRVSSQAMYEDATTDLRPVLGRITAKPFHVLYATGAGPQAKTIWERDYAGSMATLVPIADSYHFIMLDQPAAFADALRTFLNLPRKTD